jgi:hypothetical protein
MNDPYAVDRLIFLSSMNHHDSQSGAGNISPKPYQNRSQSLSKKPTGGKKKRSEKQ